MAGLELLYSSVKSDFLSKNDALITILHSFLLQQGYKSVGVGERFPEADEKLPGSEHLPRNWNQDQLAYVLRYTKKGVAGGASGSGSQTTKKLLLKAIPHNESLLISFLETPGEATAELTLKANEYLSTNYREFSQAFASESSLPDLQKLFNNEVVSKLNAPNSPKGTPKGNANLQSSPNRRTSEDANSRRIPPPTMPVYGERGHDFNADLREPFPRVGGSDLDPLNRGYGGGMILDPRELYGSGGRPGVGPNYPGGFGPRGGNHGLPPGAAPPGARFDPFGPPAPGPRPDRFRGPRPGPGGPGGPGAFSGPDPDHERPPPGSDYDDMFM